jgi:AcrR family transcriptional regulator
VSSPGTRDRILQAALTCFLQDGYEQATIARIRERSGVSNGALFHHFRSKEAIADTLHVEGISSFQEGLWELVHRRPRSLRSAVHDVIAHQMRWIEEHADLARFVYIRGHLEWDSPAGHQVASLNRDLANAMREWMRPSIQSGEIRTSSMLVITAIVSGPAHALAQRWLAGHCDRPPSEFVDELSLAAWAGLRGTPASGRNAPVRSAERGRMTLELLDDDGEVLARADASAELTPI